MLRQGLFATALVFALSSAASALTLLPDSVLTNSYDDYKASILDGTEADFFGTSQAVVEESVTETRDGLIGTDVITDLYVVTSSIKVEAIKSASGKQVFAYNFASQAGSSPGINGSRRYTLSGFAGYDVEFGYVGDPAFPYGPEIKRSANGNNIDFSFVDPRDTDDPLGFIETFYFSTNAPTFNLLGFGATTIFIDSFGTTGRMVMGLAAPAAIPLPAPVLALGGGLLALAGLRRRRKAS